MVGRSCRRHDARVFHCSREKLLKRLLSLGLPVRLFVQSIRGWSRLMGDVLARFRAVGSTRDPLSIPVSADIASVESEMSSGQESWPHQLSGVHGVRCNDN